MVEALLNAAFPTSRARNGWRANVLQESLGAGSRRHARQDDHRSMLAWILEYAGLQPGFLIGGVPANFGSQRAARRKAVFCHRGGRVRHRVLRQARQVRALPAAHAGAEQSRVRSRRHLSRPRSIERQFHHLVRIVPGSGKLLINAADEQSGASAGARLLVAARAFWPQRQPRPGGAFAQAGRQRL